MDFVVDHPPPFGKRPKMSETRRLAVIIFRSSSFDVISARAAKSHGRATRGRDLRQSETVVAVIIFITTNVIRTQIYRVARKTDFLFSSLLLLLLCKSRRTITVTAFYRRVSRRRRRTRAQASA